MISSHIATPSDFAHNPTSNAMNPATKSQPPAAGQAAHTPTPWHSRDGWRPSDGKRDLPPTRWIQIFGPDKDSEKDFIWQLEAPSHDKAGCLRVEANTRLILRAVNTHAQLVDALQWAVGYFDDPARVLDSRKLDQARALLATLQS